MSMHKREPTQAQQDEAYDHGYRSREHFGHFGPGYKNPYDSDKFWLLFMAYEQGWNDRAAWERKQTANPNSPEAWNNPARWSKA